MYAFDEQMWNKLLVWNKRTLNDKLTLKEHNQFWISRSLVANKLQPKLSDQVVQWMPMKNTVVIVYVYANPFPHSLQQIRTEQ